MPTESRRGSSAIHTITPMDLDTFEVIVIGGGHAGLEAAWAAANLLPGVRTVALVTMDPSKIGVMSCNPAIGGLAKGQLVREVDALGGLMGLATDAAGIQFKMLNTSKGPAVQGPRAQCDKQAYALATKMLIGSRPEIEVIAGSVDSLMTERGRVVGVCVMPRGMLRANAVVLTTGTFMRGLMHTGTSRTAGGRVGEGAAHAISDALRGLGFELGRLKTGTPPRLRRESICWASLEEQVPDEQPLPFSELTRAPGVCAHDLSHWWRAEEDLGVAGAASRERLGRWRDAGFEGDVFPLMPAVSCRMTTTNAAAHGVIRENLHRAPMFTGQIESVGPRYCPSIEDKVVRFAQRDGHGVFLEPESLESDWVYCNGISTSLPADVQDQLVRAMPGCENAEILRHGYAVEYDMVRPHQIDATGQTKSVAGLFLAGQINGTSGYEEAAAQGVVAGINAARVVRGEEPVTLGRDEAYIGVLMDDLVTKTPVEPYRMFTSRAEHRLLLRADNAADRLTPHAEQWGVLSHHALGARRRAVFAQRASEIRVVDDAIERGQHEGQPLDKVLRGQGFEVGDLRRALADVRATDAVWRTVHADRRYAAYIVRMRTELRRLGEIEHRALPASMDYLTLHHLRAEARQALHRFRPRTFGQAARLEGITPADITLLRVLVHRGEGGAS
jgi:tRNA uridine 5-carboxymethylaminomethyl modification enzyme